METLNRKKTALINAAYYALILGMYIVFFRYIIYRMMPFFLACIVAILLSKPTDALSKWLHLPRKGISLLLVLVFYVAIGSVLTLMIMRMIWFIGRTAAGIPEWYTTNIQPFIHNVLNWYETTVVTLDPDITAYIEDLAPAIFSGGLELANSVAAGALKITKAVALRTPATAVGIVVCIVSSFLISADYPGIKYFFLAQLTEDGKNIANKTMEYIGSSLSRMIRSYALILGVTFTELLIGFWIIGVGNMVRLAFVISILDILPILGVGTALIPWSIVMIIKGNYVTAAEFLALYVIIYIVRQIMEPRIVGMQVGLSPVLVLISIFVGVTLLGPLGLITMPMTLIVVKDLNDNGYIHLFNSDYIDSKKRTVRKKRPTPPDVTNEMFTDED